MTAPVALFVGDVSWDLSLMASHVPGPDEKVFVDQSVEGPGGVATNAAIACAVAGGVTRLLAPIGGDPVGDEVARFLGQHGIDAHLENVGGATTRAVSILDSSGEKRLLLAPGVRMYPTQRAVASLDLSDVAWVHTAVYDRDTASALIERCRQASIPWSLDLEPATFPGGITDLKAHLRGCDTVMLNTRASALIEGDAVKKLHALGVIHVVETLGPDGVRVHRVGEAPIFVPAPDLPGRVVDTTGAGDAFAGWLVAERIAGRSLELALATAVTAASASVRKLGASSSYESRREIFPHYQNR